MSKLLVAWHHFKTITETRARMLQRGKQRAIQSPGCTIRVETVIIMNIGRM